jgi:uroporphyrin-III C-methyltransferase/precorrin-2 dehydrogenase/sirohydrochlorin ferrochelatase
VKSKSNDRALACRTEQRQLELVVHGLPPTTPAAIVHQGTTAQQRVVVGTLADLPGRAFDARLLPPTQIIVGEVVRLRDKLGWFQPDASGAVARPAARGVAD